MSSLGPKSVSRSAHRGQRASLAALLGAALLVAGCGSLASASSRIHGRSVAPRTCTGPAVGASASRLPAAPSVFATADGSGPGTAIRLRSAASGRALSTLARFGSDFTNNGLALSPNVSNVYFTLIPSQHRSSNLLIECLAVSDHKRLLVASGWEPSLSPDGRLLAYISYRRRAESVAVKNVLTGQTRSINVDAAVGHGHVLDEIPPGWLSDSSAIVLPVGLPARLDVGSARARGGTSHPNSARPRTVRLIVVRVPPRRRLAARSVLVSGLRGHPLMLAPDAIAPNTIVSVTLGSGNDALLDEIQFTPASATGRPLLTIQSAQVLAFDPSGQRLLYLAIHRPPELWRGTIEQGRLIDRRRLIKDPSLGASAW